MKKKSLFLIFGLLFTKVFGIVRELALGNLYGPGAISDAYIIASNIPNVIFGFLASGLVTTFIPIYSKVKSHKGLDVANKLMSNIMNILAGLSLILALFGFVFAEFLVNLFASGFDPSTQALAASFVRVSIFSVLFLAIKSICEGYLQINQMFLINPINGFVMNLIVISTIVVSFFTKQPVIMAYGILFASVVQTIISIILTKKYGYKHEMFIDIKDENIGSMVKMAGPIILGSSIDQINKIIDTSIASSVMSGGVSTLNFAVKISDSILGIFVSAIATVMYPSLATQAAEGKMDQLKKTISKVLVSVNLLIIPASIGLMILSYPVIDILYGRKFTPEQLTLTSTVLTLYSVGTIAFGMRQILVRTFYALHDSITPVVSGIVAVVINIVLNLILSRIMGLPGLALATSISAYVSVVFLYAALRRKVGAMNTRLFIQSSVKTLVSAIIMGAVVYLIYNTMGGKVGFAVSIVAGVIVYGVSILVMKIDETDAIFQMVLKKIKR